MRLIISFLFTVLFITAKSQDTIPASIFSLEQYQNRVLQNNDTLYIVNFWATWCKPCVRELPYFETLRQEWKDKPVKFVLVSQDAKSSAKKVTQFITNNNYGAEVFILSAGNPNIWIDQIEPKWSGGIPATIIYKQGQKINFHEGDFADKNELETFIQSKY